MAHEIRVVDVFAEERYEGNPLAVVLGAGGLAGQEMQAIAREMNLSETTFVCGVETDGSHRVRIFTPTEELPFAGHPTLGTAAVLRAELAKEGEAPAHRVVLSLGVGRVSVDFESDGIAWFVAPPVELGAFADPLGIADMLGLSPDDLEDDAAPRAVRAGPAFVFVPLRSRAALERAHPGAQAFDGLAEQGFARSIYLFTRETSAPENDLCARCFFEAGGVREDPATGSATAMLGAYLLEHPMLGAAPLDLRVEQGLSMKRPSLLRLRARRGDAGDEIRVGGQIVPVLRGHLG